MPEPKLDREVCVNCGADVRTNTQFCYSCGRSVTNLEASKEIGRADPLPNESLAELEKALAASRKNDDAKARLGTAAVERKRARSGNRKPLEIVWEPTNSSFIYFIAVAALFILAVILVFVSRTAR